MKKSSFLFFSAIIAFVFTTCKKENLAAKLPPLTTEGKMLYSCIFKNNFPFIFTANGNYEVTGGLFSICHGGCEAQESYWNNDEITIFAKNCDDYPNPEHEISIYLKNTFSAGDEVKIGGDSKNSCYIYTSVTGYKSSKADSTMGYGTVKIIRADSILSGTFNITTYTDEKYEIKLTDGRFDIKMEK